MTYSDPNYRVETVLRRLGLTRYQARVLEALVDRARPAGSDSIAELSGVPRTSVYGACAHLEAMGLVTVYDGPAMRWAAESWPQTWDRMREHLSRVQQDRFALIDGVDR